MVFFSLAVPFLPGEENQSPSLCFFCLCNLLIYQRNKWSNYYYYYYYYYKRENQSPLVRTNAQRKRTSIFFILNFISSQQGLWSLFTGQREAPVLLLLLLLLWDFPIIYDSLSDSINGFSCYCISLGIVWRGNNHQDSRSKGYGGWSKTPTSFMCF